MHTNVKTKKLKFLLITSVFLVLITLISLQIQKTTIKDHQTSFLQSESQSVADFYKKQCGFCHTSEELIAPDMKKIKATYLEKYQNKVAFIEAVTNFVKNPDKKTAIYKEGIDNFMDMPKMPFKEEQIKAVADYIFENSDL